MMERNGERGAGISTLAARHDDDDDDDDDDKHNCIIHPPHMCARMSKYETGTLKKRFKFKT